MRLAGRLYLTVYGLNLLIAFHAQGTLGPSDFTTGAVLAAFLFPPVFLPFAIWGLVFKSKRGRGLDRVLFYWNRRDPFFLRDLLNSVAILGQIGSGKSSGSGLLLARAITRIPSGILVLCSKPEDRAWWIARAKEAGRLKDVIVFGKDTGHTSNYLEYLMKLGADAREITEFLTVSAEVLSPGDKGGADQFWRLSEQRLLYCAVVALIFGLGKVDAQSLLAFLTDAANSAEKVGDDSWLQGFHAKTLEAAIAHEKRVTTSVAAKADLGVCKKYWLREYPNMDDKPRSSILAGVYNLTHTYNAGEVYSAISTGTTFTLDELKDGKIIIADFPYHEFGASGKFIMSATKYLTQKMVLRRRVNAKDIPIVIYADEAQNVINSFDATYLAECRSHKGCLVYLTQSLHSFMQSEG